MTASPCCPSARARPSPGSRRCADLVDWSYDLLDERERTLVPPARGVQRWRHVGRHRERLRRSRSMPRAAIESPDATSTRLDRPSRRQVAGHRRPHADGRPLPDAANAGRLRIRTADRAPARPSGSATATLGTSPASSPRSNAACSGTTSAGGSPGCELEWANITSAIDHALAIDDAEMAIALVAPLGWYFFMTDETAAGAEWLHAALACSGKPDPRLYSLALASYAFLAATGPDPGDGGGRCRAGAGNPRLVRRPGDRGHGHRHVRDVSVVPRPLRGVQAGASLSPRRQPNDRATDGRSPCPRSCGPRSPACSANRRKQNARCDAPPTDSRRSATASRTLICVTHAAELAEMRGDYDPAVRMLEESLAVAEDVGFSVRGLATRSRLANLEILRGNLALAASIHRQSLDASAGPVPQWVHAITLLGLANIARRRGEPHEALRYIDDGMVLPRSPRIPLMHTSLLVARGYSADLAGDVRAGAGCAARGPGRRAPARRDPGHRQRGRGAGRCAGPRRRRRAMRLACSERPTRCVVAPAARCLRPSGSTSTGPNVGPARPWATDAFTAAFDAGAARRLTRRSCASVSESSARSQRRRSQLPLPAELSAGTTTRCQL